MTHSTYEEDLARALRAWRKVAHDTDEAARTSAEGILSEALGSWFSELLSAETWPLKGRWFDGLSFQECITESQERFRLSGYMWSIDQRQHPFRATIQLSDDGLSTFDVRLGTSDNRTHRGRVLLSIDSEWTFQFTRNE